MDRLSVINALSDLHHPLQALADMLTLQVHTKTIPYHTIRDSDSKNALGPGLFGC